MKVMTILITITILITMIIMRKTLIDQINNEEDLGENSAEEDKTDIKKSQAIQNRNEDLGYNPFANNKGSGGKTAENKNNDNQYF
jgi:hypothetical protein